MKQFRFTYISFIVLATIFFVWALTLPSHLAIQKQKVYKAEKTMLFNELSDLNGWINWFPWITDEMTTNIQGNPGTAKHSLSWEHPEYGRGNVVIKEIIGDSIIQTEMQFENSREVLNSDFRIITKYTGETELRWTISYTEPYPYPLGRIRANLLNKMISANMEEAMQDIASLLDK